MTTGDVVAWHAAEEDALRRPGEGAQVLYGTLRAMGVIAGPATFRQLRAHGPRTPEQMIDRYGLESRPVRDVLVDYLRERQPALDYSTLQQLGYILGKLFWADIEQHHPGISSLHLPDDVARAWKQRLQVKESGGATAERIGSRPCLTNVRAFYLDLAQWALDDPSRWAQWAVPCPVRQNETVSRKMTQHRKSRMDARTRERLPVLPALVSAAARHRADTASLLTAARQAGAGEEFTAAGRTLVRLPVKGGSPFKVWARDPVAGRRADLTGQEDYAFWAWAVIEVLRHTGIRIEELLELSHHSLVQYRLPGTGELVPLLQVIPSKTDAERLLLISPDLADVLAAVISRVRAPSGAIPLVAAYDHHERRWMPPAPLLFQRRFRGYDQALHETTIRRMLAAAVARAGLADPATGQPLAYTPHDFRRMFITDAVLNGLPPHIAQVIAGHRDINVTMGYKAVYPDEAIQAHRAFLARRRALRPGAGIPRPHRRGMAAVPRPLRTPQGRHRNLRARVRDPLPPRARLHPLPHALARPRPEAAPHRDPRQPHRPHRRSRTRRLARRNGRPQDQPRRRRGQTHPDHPPAQPCGRPRHPVHPALTNARQNGLKEEFDKFRESVATSSATSARLLMPQACTAART